VGCWEGGLPVLAFFFFFFFLRGIRADLFREMLDITLRTMYCEECSSRGIDGQISNVYITTSAIHPGEVREKTFDEVSVVE